MYEPGELLKGADAFLNGVAPSRSGIGGSVNLVPKRAGDEPLNRITGSYGMTSQFGVHLDSGRRFGPDNAFGVRVNAVGRDGETAIEDEERSTLLGTCRSSTASRSAAGCCTPPRNNWMPPTPRRCRPGPGSTSARDT